MLWYTIVPFLALLTVLPVNCSLQLNSGDNTHESNKPLEHRRIKRQLGEIVRLYNQLAFENRRDRDKAVERIREIIGQSFRPASPPKATSSPAQISLSTTEKNENSTSSGEGGETTSTPMTPLDRTMLSNNLRRNLKGLGRLFMKELRAALQGVPVEQSNNQI